MRELKKTLLKAGTGVCLGVQILAAAAQTPNPPETQLTSVAIDPTLYRDGAINRFSGAHGRWTFVCDEVAKLKQRFCSLRSLIRSASGDAVANLTISTGQDGRPAALLVLPADQVSRIGIEVLLNRPAAPQGNGLVKSKLQNPVRVYPAACTAELCQLIWSLPPAHIDALNTGSGLIVRYVPPPPSAPAPAASLGAIPTKPIELPIPADGFAAAVAASLAPRD